MNPRYTRIKKHMEALKTAVSELEESIDFRIRNQSTADVQEVVRCKDCKSYNKHYGECTLFGAHLGENGFCSEGAKMDKSDIEHNKIAIPNYDRWIKTI